MVDFPHFVSIIVSSSVQATFPLRDDGIYVKKLPDALEISIL
jgi:hypothetical protein